MNVIFVLLKILNFCLKIVQEKSGKNLQKEICYFIQPFSGKKHQNAPLYDISP